MMQGFMQRTDDANNKVLTKFYNFNQNMTSMTTRQNTIEAALKSLKGQVRQNAQSMNT